MTVLNVENYYFAQPPCSCVFVADEDRDPFGQHQKDHLAGKELFPISGSSALSKIFEAICLSLVTETYLHSK